MGTRTKIKAGLGGAYLLICFLCGCSGAPTATLTQLHHTGYEYWVQVPMVAHHGTYYRVYISKTLVETPAGLTLTGAFEARFHPLSGKIWVPDTTTTYHIGGTFIYEAL